MTEAIAAETGADERTLERSTLRTARRRLIPFLFALYIVSFLDRVNVGFAALEMNRDLGFSPTVYGFGAGIFFIGYALFEVPSNLILARMGARLWIARIMITWGIIAACMMLVRGPISFYVLRFLLGVAEAGFFPGIIFYLSEWFPAEMRARVAAQFITAIPIAGIIGGPISGALLGLNGQLGLTGWQWLFLIEGIPAVLLGIAVLAWLPDKPNDAAWLAPEQRRWLTQRMTGEKQLCAQRHGFGVLRALSNRTVWQMGLLGFLCISFGQYALALWLPQIVRGFSGLSNLQIGLVTSIPNLFAVMAMIAVAAYSDRNGDRCVHMAGTAGVAALGFFGAALFTAPALVVLCLSFALAGCIASHGPFWPLPSKFLTGAAAAGAIALINSIANLSGFVGPYVLGRLNNASGDFHSGLLVLALVPAAGAILALRLRHAAVLRDPLPDAEARDRLRRAGAQ